METSNKLWRHRRKFALALLLILIPTAWAIHSNQDDMDWEKFVSYGEGLPAGWFLLAFLVLPLVGFPISPP